MTIIEQEPGDNGAETNESFLSFDPEILAKRTEVSQSLSDKVIDQLICFKLRYSLEVQGFTKKQANELLFKRWLYQNGRFPPEI